MHAEVIAIGSELASGQRVDTNSAWLSQQLEAMGIPVHIHTTLRDDLADNETALREAIERANLLLLTGGLGPTQDDLTREALAAVAGVPLEEDAESLAAIVALFANRNRPMPERNRSQALLPQGAEALGNRVGTAPGIWLRLGQATIIALPGVPMEMRVMFEEQVRPRLQLMGLGGRVIVHRKINLFGRGESDIESEALDLTARGRVPEVGITAHDATISLRITAAGATEEEALRLIEPTAALIHQRFGKFVVGEGEDDVAEGLVRELAHAQATLATAESCTGGLIGHRLTTIAGVSSCYLGGVVCYSNHAKIELVGVDAGLIESQGAVSPEVAEALAAGIRQRLNADLGVSVTGVAGPSGGTTAKPVGLVYLGLATRDSVASRRLEIGPEQPRQVIQSRAAKHAMNWARLHLLEQREQADANSAR